MATKKNNTKKAISKPVLNKIAQQVGHIAGEIAAGKDHFMEMAGDAIDSVKTTIQNIAPHKKTVAKKTAKTPAKKATVAKKVVAKKSIAKKVAKKATKTITPKKTAAAKKIVKKAATKSKGKK